MTDESVRAAAEQLMKTVNRFAMSESSLVGLDTTDYLASGGSGGGGPPADNVWPLGRITFLMRPTGAPLLTGCSATVTSSPALNDVRAQPRFVMSVGLLTSAAQFRTEPVSSFASNFRKQWGLAQIHSVTVPFKVSSFVVSKLAAPWCATSGTEATRRPTAPRKTPKNLFVTGASVSETADRPHHRELGRACQLVEPACVTTGEVFEQDLCQWAARETADARLRPQ